MQKNYVFNNGYFYQLTNVEEGIYKRLELYLPAGSGTYGEPIESTKDRWLTDLNELDGFIRLRKPLAGKMVKQVGRAVKDSGGLNSNPYIFNDSGKLVRKDQFKGAR